MRVVVLQTQGGVAGIFRSHALAKVWADELDLASPETFTMPVLDLRQVAIALTGKDDKEAIQSIIDKCHATVEINEETDV